MRVAHVTPYFAPAFRYGGPPRSILGLCTALQQAGVEVEVVTTAANGGADLPWSPDVRLFDNVPVRYCRPAFPRRFFGADIARALREAIGRADLCHIHGLWNVPEWQAARLCRATGVPYVLSPRGMLQPAALARGTARKRVAYRLLERRNLLGAARLHATSDEEASTLAQYVPDGRVVTIPNGVEIPDAIPRGRLRARLAIDSDDPIVVFLGRLHPIKRLDLLASAVARVRERVPALHLVVAGPDENEFAATLARAFAPLGDHVHLVGPVDGDEKRALVADATLVAVCSDSESFGMSVVEAMAAGVPVVVTKTCPWEEVAAEGSGLWVEQTVDAVAAGIETIVSDRTRAADMGRAGARVARGRYAWRAVADAMSRCYRDVLSERRAVA